jgi:hypothetical protein
MPDDHASFTVVGPNPPEQITSDTYKNWLGSINSKVSAFLPYAFNWYQAQSASPLPSQVLADPKKLYITVEQAIKETVTMENSGDIEEGVAMGYDAYRIVQYPISAALDTLLFFCGKPVGQSEGETHPHSSIFGACHCSLKEQWGPRNDTYSASLTNGGIISDWNDNYTALIRGSDAAGYSIFSSFFGPMAGLDTATKNQISIMTLRAQSATATEFRQYLRREGQSYKVFGLDFGRKNFGFKVSRFRQAEEDIFKAVV